MVFITDLPQTPLGNIGILVIVDIFSKMAYFISIGADTSAKNIADIFFCKIVKFHGLPLSILSD